MGDTQQSILEEHVLRYDYSDKEYGDFFLKVCLRRYLNGKPNNEIQQRWMEVMEYMPVPYGERLIPLFAILDFYKLKQQDPDIARKIFGDMPIELPSLEYALTFA